MFEFIEAPLFFKLRDRYLSDDEFSLFQLYLTEHPYSGRVIQGSGGIRKLRWGTGGRGKRGGLRVIYYLKGTRNQIWLLTIYSKNVPEEIPREALRKIREAIDEE